MNEYIILVYPVILLIIYTCLVIKRIKRGYRPPDSYELHRRAMKNKRLAALRKRLIEEGRLKDYTKPE